MSSKRIIIGVSGGVAVFKAAALVSRLAQSDFDVQVVMTAGAQQFVGEATFAALSGRRVAVDLFDRRYPLGAHIELARDAELMCIAPATANFLAKAATGLADDLLSTLYLCFTGPVIVAPAMNSEMWEKPAVARNMKMLEDDGVSIVGPDMGWLSCRVRGRGRMADPDTVFEAIASSLS